MNFVSNPRTKYAQKKQNKYYATIKGIIMMII
jgi:hypothetical protein